MNDSLIKVCYQGDKGNSDIRTLRRGDILYVSLVDVMTALNRENKKDNENHRSASMPKILRGLLEDLEEDEYIYVDNEKMTHTSGREMFLTQPGLFRVLSHDRSKAGKAFQRWLYHDVVPSLTKHGVYPAPLVNPESEVKRAVQLLLAEIEQREKLEQETKEQFIKHEKMISSIELQLEKLQSNHSDTEFASISDFCETRAISLNNFQLIQGYCMKICLENSEPTSKRVIKDQSIQLYPVHVILEAVQRANNSVVNTN